MKFRKDYAAANVPMLPVVASPAVVARKILWYSYAMVAATLALVPYAGWIYGVLAAALGAWFVAEAHQLKTRVAAADADGQASSSAAKGAPMRLFHLSIAYLTLLFAAVAVTALLPWGRWLSLIPPFRDALSALNQDGRYPVLAVSGCLP
jgi:protoheme IX farnesyltransferase